MNKTKTITLCALLLTFGIGCNKKEDTPITNGGGGVTSAELVGTSSVCRSGGTTFSTAPGVGTSSYLETIRFNANETFSYDQYWYTGTVCQLGGTSLFAYTYSGTFAMGAVTTEGFTKIDLSITASYMSVFPSVTVGDYFKAQFQTGTCANAMDFSLSNTDTSVTTTSCNNVGHNWVLSQFALHVPIYNVLTLDTNANVLSLGANSAQWYVGNTFATYPTTVPHVFTNFQ